MHDLCCALCARVVIADFWTMVQGETVPMFSAIRLTCSCGARIKVDLRRPQGRDADDPGAHLPAVLRPALRVSGVSSISAA